jgi:hypothetical protein
MMLTGFGRFDLAYFRHTERWFIGVSRTDDRRVPRRDRRERGVLADGVIVSTVPDRSDSAPVSADCQNRPTAILPSFCRAK